MLVGTGLTLAILGVLATLLPITRSTHWWVRVFDFPRMQVSFLLACASVLLALVAAGLGEPSTWSRSAAIVGLVATVAALIWQIRLMRPYSRFAAKQVAPRRSYQKDREFRILVSNVKQDNRISDKVIRHIRHYNPHIVFIVECDEWWIRQIDAFYKDFPYTIRNPKDNGYGLAVYSRLPIHDGQVRYIREPHIPSVDFQVELPCGELVRCIGLHPAPPVPQWAEETDQRDAELVTIAKEVRRYDGPTVVFGDLNDVAWSPTTKLFQQLSGMLDPRIGRGQFNTFHADHALMRYPLDHIFLSPHFRLGSLQVLTHVGSDHFPILAVLELVSAQQAPRENLEEQPEVTPEAIEEASEVMEQANRKLNAVHAPSKAGKLRPAPR